MKKIGIWIDFLSNKVLIEENSPLHWRNQIFSFLNNWYNNNPILTTFTSGTTGKPKKISLYKHDMFDRAINTVKTLNIEKIKIRGLLCLSPDFIASKMFLIRAIIFKWKIYCIPPTSKPLNNIKDSFDISSMVPMQVIYSLEKIENIKILLIGGSNISENLEKKLQNVSTKCYATYGMTETYSHIAMRRINGTNKSLFYKILKDVNISIDNRKCLKVILQFSVKKYVIQTNDIVDLISDRLFFWKGRYDNIINSGGIKIIPELLEKYINPFITPFKRRFFISSVLDEVLGEKIILIVEGIPVSVKIPDHIFYGKKIFYKPKNIFFISNFIENSFGKIKRKETTKKLVHNIMMNNKNKLI
ncbi:AMP-binding protein [Blattabacterium cuenoti]|uniref:AMP-binding protein n=1 Tax=Blattabacterium cuenoti TaxID=1653831 RepID=UPI00163D3A0B|nr:AMP-binding protein [Blattabacterium cuenoti]